MIAWDVVLVIECTMNASAGPPVAGVRDMHTARMAGCQSKSRTQPHTISNITASRILFL
jgi:hypothetical protein